MLREFKAHPEFGSIPVVVLTHEERDPLLDTCFQAGAEDYLPKPIRQEVLLERPRLANRPVSDDPHDGARMRHFNPYPVFPSLLRSPPRRSPASRWTTPCGTSSPKAEPSGVSRHPTPIRNPRASGRAHNLPVGVAGCPAGGGVTELRRSSSAKAAGLPGSQRQPEPAGSCKISA